MGHACQPLRRIECAAATKWGTDASHFVPCQCQPGGIQRLEQRVFDASRVRSPTTKLNLKGAVPDISSPPQCLLVSSIQTQNDKNSPHNRRRHLRLRSSSHSLQTRHQKHHLRTSRSSSNDRRRCELDAKRIAYS